MALPSRGRSVSTTRAPGANADGSPQSLLTWTRSVEQAVAGRAAALVILMPESPDDWARIAFRMPRGSYALNPDGRTEPRTPPAGMPVLYVR